MDLKFVQHHVKHKTKMRLLTDILSNFDMTLYLKACISP